MKIEVEVVAVMVLCVTSTCNNMLFIIISLVAAKSTTTPREGLLSFLSTWGSIGFSPSLVSLLPAWSAETFSSPDGAWQLNSDAAVVEALWISER